MTSERTWCLSRRRRRLCRCEQRTLARCRGCRQRGPGGGRGAALPGICLVRVGSCSTRKRALTCTGRSRTGAASLLRSGLFLHVAAVPAPASLAFTVLLLGGRRGSPGAPWEARVAWGGLLPPGPCAVRSQREDEWCLPRLIPVSPAEGAAPCQHPPAGGTGPGAQSRGELGA